MNRYALPLAATTLLALWITGCTTTKDEPPPPPPTELKLTILQTTDVHDHAMGTGHVQAGTLAPEGGYPRIAAYVNHVRASTDHPVVLLDSGDWSMGTLYDLTLGQQPLSLYFMSALGYNCATLGNHEFDYTAAGLAKILNAASAFKFWTPVVASNLNLNGEPNLTPFVGAGKTVTPTAVETLKNGLKVGYLGLMGKNATSVAPLAAPVTFTDYTANNYALVKSLVDDLRTNQKCDVVIALSHSGTNPDGASGEDIDLARNVSGIDVIASGHTHNAFSNARTVTNGNWKTQVICAGAYGNSVARIDLTYAVATKTVGMDASSNVAMTDASLNTIKPGLVADPIFASIVNSADKSLNAGLQPFFSQVFPDYDPLKLDTGLYHPVGIIAQAMVPNDVNPVPCPNGMGNLCADAVRDFPNALVVKALLAAGWNGSPTDPNLPAIMGALAAAGFDPTFYTAGVVPTGVIRGNLAAGGAITFADVYNVLPLGFTPDTSQSLPVGYPLVSAYLDLADVKKLCALQLVAQSNLASSDLYLNLSGLKYSLKATEAYAYFKSATAAAVLQLTSAKATAGSSSALAAMGALSSLGTDSGAALLAAMQGGNPYAAAMVKLNDATPDQAMIGANLMALGQVAGAAQTGALTGLIVNKAIATIDVVSAFAPTDVACKGGAGPLDGATRYRISGDLYSILMMGAAQTEFGITITPYKAGSGTAVLSPADMAGLLGNRIDLDPSAASPGVQEVKDWMALLFYLTLPVNQLGLGGQITADYASTALFSQFATFGAAVQTRSASYPIASLGQMMTTLGTLKAAP